MPSQQDVDAAMQAALVPAESDARVINNVMRHEYRILTEEEKLQMKELKDMGLQFVKYIEASGRKSREMSLAITKIEEAVMWAVKDITK